MHKITAVFDPENRSWHCEVWSTAGALVHVTSAAANKIRAERLAQAWIEEHCDAAACC